MRRAGAGDGWRLSVVALAVLVAACSSSAPLASATLGNPTPLPSVDLTAPMKTGSLDSSLVALVHGLMTTDPTAAAALGTANTAADRAQANAGVVVDPSIPQIDTAIDGAVAAAEQALEAKVKSSLPNPSGPPSSPSARLGPGTDGGMVLAAYRKPPAETRPVPAGAMLQDLLTWVIFFGGAAFEVYDPKQDSYTFTNEVTQPIDSNGITGEITATVAIEATSKTLNFAMQVDEQAQKSDSTGAIVGSVVGTSTYSFTINPCPDASGVVAGHIEMTDSETDYGSNAAQTDNLGFRYSGSEDYTAQIDDQAQVASIAVNGKAERTVKGGTSKAGSNGFEPVESDLGVSFADSLNGAGGVTTSGDWSATTAGNATAADGKALGSMISVDLEAVTGILLNSAGAIFRGGRCFEIRVTPDGGSVGPSSKISVAVKIYHWVDKAEVQLPVKATLSGPQAIDPADTNQTTPATVTYTAGQPNTTGVVTFRSVSKRGIAEHTSTFDVSQHLDVVITGTLVESSAGLAVYHLRISATNVSIVPSKDGSLVVSGDASVTGTITFNSAPCSGAIDEHISVIGLGALQGPDDAKVYHVLFGPGSVTNLGGTVTCPYIGVVKSSNGDFFGQWSTTIGYVDLPATGGTVQKKGSTGGLLSRDASGTYVATAS